MIDIATLHQEFDRYAITDIGWLASVPNILDSFTKRGACVPLESFLETGKFPLHVAQLVVRKKTTERRNIVNLRFVTSPTLPRVSTVHAYRT